MFERYIYYDICKSYSKLTEGNLPIIMNEILLNEIIYIFQIGEICCVLSFLVEEFQNKSLKYFQFTRFYPKFQ